MDVILTQDISHLGKRGDVVKVKNGYARNYLIPKKLALVASQANQEHFKEVMRQTRARIQKQESEAQVLKSKLDGEHVKVTLAFGETGKAYGSVTAKEISAAFREKGLYFDHHQVVLDHPLKEAGAHDIKIHLFGEVDAAVKVWVVPEGESEVTEAPSSQEASVSQVEPEPASFDEMEVEEPAMDSEVKEEGEEKEEKEG